MASATRADASIASNTPSQENVIDDSEKYEKKNLYQKFLEFITLLSTKLSEFAKISSYYVPVTNYIETEPTEKRSLVGQNGEIYATQEIVLGVLSKNSMKYRMLKVLLLLMFYIIPLVIFGMAIAYMSPILNIPGMMKEKKFYNDVIIFRELDKIYNIYGLYINDYILYMFIVCTVYLIILVYIFLNKYVKKDHPDYVEFKTKIYIFFALSFLTVLLHFLYYYDKVQRIGAVRDRLIKTTGDHMSSDYILFLEENDKANTDLLVLNNIDNLTRYISGILIELKTITSPSDITLMTVEQFKTYKNEKQQRYYDLILDAIITYNLILNIANNEYNDGDVKHIDRSYFINKKSLLLTVNYQKNCLMELNARKCIDRILDGKENTSPFMVGICKDCRNINNQINESIIEIKNITNHLIFPPQLVTALFVTFISIIYYYSFLIFVRTVNADRNERYNEANVATGTNGVNGVNGANGMYY